MALSNLHPWMVFLAIFTIMISHSDARNAHSELVEDICRKTAHFQSITFEDCVNALQLNSRTATANLTVLARISIQLAISNSTNSQTFIKNMASNETTPPSFKEPLKTCLSCYEGVIMSFKSAVNELDEDVLSANYDVKIAGDDAKACEDALANSEAKIPSVTVRNNYAMLYSSIAFVITGQL